MGADKAAILLSRMPPEVVEAVLAKIDPNLAGRMGARILEIQKTPPTPQVLEQALFEMRDLLRAAQTPAPTSEKRDNLTDEFVPSSTAGRSQQAGDAPSTKTPAAPESPAEMPVDDPVVALLELEPTILAAALRDERVVMAAVTLGCLPAARVGEVLKLLPKDFRRDVTLSLGDGTNRPPEFVATVVRAVVVKGRAFASRPAELDENARIKKLAELLRNLERDDRKEILESLLAKDPAAAEKVKKEIYLFEDLLRIENQSLQALLSEVDMKTLARALRGAGDEYLQKVLTNLSKRAGESLNEEAALITSSPASVVNAARDAIVEIMQNLDKDGKLVMLE